MNRRAFVKALAAILPASWLASRVKGESVARTFASRNTRVCCGVWSLMRDGVRIESHLFYQTSCMSITRRVESVVQKELRLPTGRVGFHGDRNRRTEEQPILSPLDEHERTV